MCEDFSFVDNPEFKSFISQYSTTDASTLRLKRFDNLKFDKNLAITQIECRRKAKKKLPELAEKIAYPTDVSIEQCSSEILAKFHANLFAGCDAVVDLTCGLGIDSFYIAQQAKSVVSIDAAEIVTSAVKHNMHKLGINNVSVVNDFAESYLDKVKNPFSAAFMRFRTLVPFSDAEAAASDKLPHNRIFRQILAADAQEIVQELEQPLCLKIFRIALLNTVKQRFRIGF